MSTHYYDSVGKFLQISQEPLLCDTTKPNFCGEKWEKVLLYKLINSCKDFVSSHGTVLILSSIMVVVVLCWN